MRKSLHVENWMVGLGQPIQGKHTEDGTERRTQDRELKGDRDEGRPTVERAPANIHGVGDRSGPILKEKSADTADQTTDQSDRRYEAVPKPERFREAFHRERGICVEMPVASRADILYGMNELLRGLEFPHHAITM
jgi:hypothetical protein